MGAQRAAEVWARSRRPGRVLVFGDVRGQPQLLREVEVEEGELPQRLQVAWCVCVREGLSSCDPRRKAAATVRGFTLTEMLPMPRRPTASSKQRRLCSGGAKAALATAVATAVTDGSGATCFGRPERAAAQKVLRELDAEEAEASRDDELHGPAAEGRGVRLARDEA